MLDLFIHLFFLSVSSVHSRRLPSPPRVPREPGLRAVQNRSLMIKSLFSLHGPATGMCLRGSTRAASGGRLWAAGGGRASSSLLVQIVQREADRIRFNHDLRVDMREIWKLEQELCFYEFQCAVVHIT